MEFASEINVEEMQMTHSKRMSFRETSYRPRSVNPVNRNEDSEIMGFSYMQSESIIDLSQGFSGSDRQLRRMSKSANQPRDPIANNILTLTVLSYYERPVQSPLGEFILSVQLCQYHPDRKEKQNFFGSLFKKKADPNNDFLSLLYPQTEPLFFKCSEDSEQRMIVIEKNWLKEITKNMYVMFKLYFVKKNEKSNNDMFQQDSSGEDKFFIWYKAVPFNHYEQNNNEYESVLKIRGPCIPPRIKEQFQHPIKGFTLKTKQKWINSERLDQQYQQMEEVKTVKFYMPSQWTAQHHPWSIITPNHTPVLKRYVMSALQQRLASNKIFLKLTQMHIHSSALKKIPKGTYFRIQVSLFKVDQQDKSVQNWQSHQQTGNLISGMPESSLSQNFSSFQTCLVRIQTELAIQFDEVITIDLDKIKVRRQHELKNYYLCFVVQRANIQTQEVKSKLQQILRNQQKYDYENEFFSLMELEPVLTQSQSQTTQSLRPFYMFSDFKKVQKDFIKRMQTGLVVNNKIEQAKDMKLEFVKYNSAPQFYESNKGTSLNNFIDDQSQRYSKRTKESLETFYEGKMQNIKASVDYKNLGKSFIWSHRVLLDRIFNFLDEPSQEFPNDLFSLLFDMLYVFSNGEKYIKPVDQTLQRYPQFTVIFEKYLKEQFKFQHVHQSFLELFSNFNSFLMQEIMSQNEDLMSQRSQSEKKQLTFEFSPDLALQMCSHIIMVFRLIKLSIKNAQESQSAEIAKYKKELENELINLVKNILDLRTDLGLTLGGLIMLQSDKLLEAIVEILGIEPANNIFAKMYDSTSSLPGRQIMDESGAFTMYLSARSESSSAKKSAPHETSIRSLIATSKRQINFTDNYMQKTHQKQGVELDCEQKISLRMLNFIKVIKLNDIIEKSIDAEELGENQIISESLKFLESNIVLNTAQVYLEEFSLHFLNSRLLKQDDGISITSSTGDFLIPAFCLVWLFFKVLNPEQLQKYEDIHLHKLFHIQRKRSESSSFRKRKSMRKLGNIEPFICQLAQILREIEYDFPAKFYDRSIEQTNLCLDVEFLKLLYFIDEKPTADVKDDILSKKQPMYVYIIKLAQLSFFNIIEKQLQADSFLQYFLENKQLGSLQIFIDNMRRLIDREASDSVQKNEYHIIRLLKLEFEEQNNIFKILAKLSGQLTNFIVKYSEGTQEHAEMSTEFNKVERLQFCGKVMQFQIGLLSSLHVSYLAIKNEIVEVQKKLNDNQDPLKQMDEPVTRTKPHQINKAVSKENTKAQIQAKNKQLLEIHNQMKEIEKRIVSNHIEVIFKNSTGAYCLKMFKYGLVDTIDAMTKKLFMIFKLGDNSTTPIFIFGMFLEAEYIHSLKVEKSRELLFAFLLAYVQKLVKEGGLKSPSIEQRTQKLFLFRKNLDILIQNISDTLMNLDLYKQRLSLENKQSDFPNIVKSLIEEIKDAGQFREIIREGNIFSIYAQYMRMPKKITYLKNDMGLLREKLEKQMKELKLCKQLALVKMERWYLTAEYEPLFDVDQRYRCSISSAINSLISQHVYGDAIDYIKKRIKIAENQNDMRTLQKSLLKQRRIYTIMAKTENIQDPWSYKEAYVKISKVRNTNDEKNDTSDVSDDDSNYPSLEQLCQEERKDRYYLYKLQTEKPIMLVVNFPPEDKKISYKQKNETIKGKLFQYIDEKAQEYLFKEFCRKETNKFQNLEETLKKVQKIRIYPLKHDQIETYNLWDCLTSKDKKLEREQHELINNHSDPQMCDRVYSHFGLNKANKKFYRINNEHGNFQDGSMERKSISIYVVEEKFPCMSLGQPCEEEIKRELIRWQGVYSEFQILHNQLKKWKHEHNDEERIKQFIDQLLNSRVVLNFDCKPTHFLTLDDLKRIAFFIQNCIDQIQPMISDATQGLRETFLKLEEFLNKQHQKLNEITSQKEDCEKSQVGVGLGEKDLIKVLSQTILGPMMNKAKACLLNPPKNSKLAEMISPIIYLIAEHMTPLYLELRKSNYKKIKKVHDLSYLLILKMQSVFQGSVIGSSIDNLWDLRALGDLVNRIMEILALHESYIQEVHETIKEHIDTKSRRIAYLFSKQVFQNLLSEEPHEPYLHDLTDIFLCSKTYITNEIEKIRSQGYTCDNLLEYTQFDYHIELDDMKYLALDKTQQICQILKNRNAQLFWLCYFPERTYATIDEIVHALLELCRLTGIADPQKQYEQDLNSLFNPEIGYLVSLEKHHKFVESIFDKNKGSLFKEIDSVGSVFLTCQIKQWGSAASNQNIYTSLLLKDVKEDFELSSSKGLSQLTNPKMKMVDISMQEQLVDLVKPQVKVPVYHQGTGKTLTLMMKSGEDCLSSLNGVKVSVKDDQGLFRIGERQDNHFTILGEKRLLMVQFVITQQHGDFYLQDLSKSYPLRIRLDLTTQVNLFKNALVDIGKGVLYKVDKITYKKEPKYSQEKLMWGNDKEFEITETPTIQLRAIWLRNEHDLAANHISIEATETKQLFKLGSNKDIVDVPISVDGVSSEHCRIEYSLDNGWTISEKGIDKPSLNGTYLFVKSNQQKEEQQPSDPVLLKKGMVLTSFNYDFHVDIN